MLDKPKEVGQLLSTSVPSLLEVVRLLLSLRLTLLDADVLLNASRLGVFTSTEISKVSTLNDCHIHGHLHYLRNKGLIEIVGMRKTKKRDSKLYCLTDAGCALVARLSALCR